MDDKIIMISELTFEEAHKKAFAEVIAKSLTEAFEKKAIDASTGLLITSLMAMFAAEIKENLFGKNEDEHFP